MKKQVRELVVCICFLSMTMLCGCGLEVFDTATANFDRLIGKQLGEVVGNFLDGIVAGAEEGEDDGVTIHVLTPTPTTDPAFLPTPTPQIIATPTPANGEPALHKVDEWVYVNAETTVVRTGWSTEYVVLGNINFRDTVHRVATLENGWSKIAFNGTYGYCDSQDLIAMRPGNLAVTHLDIFQYTAQTAALGEDVHIIQMQTLFQKPDIPSGSEIASLATVLKYYGQSRISKITLASRFLPKAEAGTASPYAVYIGDPASDESFGCYAPVIVNTANSYMTNKGIRRVAEDVSKSTPEQLLEYVRQDIPVMIWVTTDMQPSTMGPTWQVDGNSYTWMEGEQCMVLIGYNKTRGTVIVCDTLKGIVEYDSSQFFTRYNEQYQNACIIR